MRRLTGALAAALVSLAAGAASAAPALEIRDAVVRVVVVPEARSDIRVDVVKANPALPLRVWTFMGRTYVEGTLRSRPHRCGGTAADPVAYVAGMGQVSADAMPQIVVHMPMAVRVSAGGPVWGQVGRSGSLE
ncbi:MAG: GIN domain-containing protein, partial [Caulobacteraceae bacterium]